MVEYGANVNAAARTDDNTPLRVAITSGRIEGVTVGNTTRYRTIATSANLEIVKYLVEHGANVEVQNEYGESLFYIAVRHEKLELVKYFVEVLGADVNTSDNRGQPVLRRAAEKDNLELVKYLVEHGADVWKTCGCRMVKEFAHTEEVKRFLEDAESK
ncbi:hypothetical protein FACS189427_12050 [Planctomycetales bacterium]|nr:hypothetical protein FACS189427_12050 [Planctomycetales bacterium]